MLATHRRGYMAEEYRAYTLLGTIMKQFRLPWYWATAVVTAVLLLFLILATFLDGVLPSLSQWAFWRQLLNSPVMITYILAVYPFIWRLWEGAVQSFQPLLPLEEGSFNKRILVYVPNRRWEWAAVIAGAVFWLSLEQPWSWTWGVDALWLYVYILISSSLSFGLLALIIYTSLARARQLTQLSRQNIEMNLFDPKLIPVGFSSLGVSLAFIGGTSLSLVFQTRESLQTWSSITIYATLVLAILLIFFLSMWSTHTAMTKAKNHELALVRQHLATASRKLRKRMSQSELNDESEFSSTIAAWVSYERRIREAPSWPFNAGIIRRLLASTVAPTVVYLIKIISGLGLRF
jgi:hypothetical protein